MFLQNLQWRYLKLSIFLSKWNSFIAMHRSLNKPLFLTTDISSAQRKGSQQKRRHHHTILAQNQWCACELPWRPQKLHPEDTSEVHKSQQTTQLLTTRQTDLSFEKVNPLSNPEHGRTHTNGQPALRQDFLFLYQAETFLPPKGTEALLGAEPFEKWGKDTGPLRITPFY